MQTQRAFQAFNSLIISTKHGRKELQGNRNGMEVELDDALPCQARRSRLGGVFIRLRLVLVLHSRMDSKV